MPEEETEFGADTGVDVYSAMFAGTHYEPWVNKHDDICPAYSPFRMLPATVATSETLFEVDVSGRLGKDVYPGLRINAGTQPDGIFTPWYAINGPSSVEKPGDEEDDPKNIGTFSCEFYTPMLLNVGAAVSLAIGDSFGPMIDSYEMTTSREGFIYLGEAHIEKMPDVKVCMQVIQEYTFGKFTSWSKTDDSTERVVEVFKSDGLSAGRTGYHRYQTPWGGRYFSRGDTDKMDIEQFGSECWFVWDCNYDFDRAETGVETQPQSCHWIGGSCK